MNQACTHLVKARPFFGRKCSGMGRRSRLPWQHASFHDLHLGNGGLVPLSSRELVCLFCSAFAICRRTCMIKTAFIVDGCAGGNTASQWRKGRGNAEEVEPNTKKDETCCLIVSTERCFESIASNNHVTRLVCLMQGISSITLCLSP